MQNILNFGNILDKFFITSGLQINKKKTFLVPVGNNETIDVINNAAAQLGKSVNTDSIDLLGFSVFTNGDTATNCWNKVRLILQKKIYIWKIFRLSLRGRITVAKAHLISSITFYATILDIPKYIIDEFTETIEKFKTSGKKVSKRTIYSSIEHGGYNMIELSSFY